MVKALVIGAGGALGRALMVRMVTTFDTIALGHHDLDITRRNDVVDRVRQVRPDIIFDAAGVADVDGCEVDKWHAYLTNRDGAKHLAIAAAEIGALLVYPSSDLVFDGAKTTPYREEDSPNPLSIFGDTKLAAELAVMNHAPRHLILRTGWLFGPYGRSYLTDYLEKRSTDELLFGFDDHRSQPTYQLDFADAVIHLVKQKQTGVWHVANQGEATPFEVGRALFEFKGMDPTDIRPLRRGAGARCALRPRYSVLDCSKLAAAGVRMRPWKDALRDYVKTMG